jgi:hypothetical protein
MEKVTLFTILSDHAGPSLKGKRATWSLSDKLNTPGIVAKPLSYKMLPGMQGPVQGRNFFFSYSTTIRQATQKESWKWSLPQNGTDECDRAYRDWEEEAKIP